MDEKLPQRMIPALRHHTPSIIQQLTFASLISDRTHPRRLLRDTMEMEFGWAQRSRSFPDERGDMDWELRSNARWRGGELGVWPAGTIMKGHEDWRTLKSIRQNSGFAHHQGEGASASIRIDLARKSEQPAHSLNIQSKDEIAQTLVVRRNPFCR